MMLVYWLLEILFPPKCMFCAALLDRQETDICRKCRISAPEYIKNNGKFSGDGKNGRVFLDSFVAVWYYEGNVREGLLRYKFRRRRGYGAAFGRFIAMRVLREQMAPFDAVTWVPVSSRRRWKRGYDQSQLIAQSIGKELEIPVVPLLKKTVHNKPQSGMGALERSANVTGVYRALHPDMGRGKRLLLVDDIYTTGATMNECTRVLLTAGAGEVHGAAVAATRKKPGR